MMKLQVASLSGGRRSSARERWSSGGVANRNLATLKEEIGHEFELKKMKIIQRKLGRRGWNNSQYVERKEAGEKDSSERRIAKRAKKRIKLESNE